MELRNKRLDELRDQRLQEIDNQIYDNDNDNENENDIIEIDPNLNKDINLNAVVNNINNPYYNEYDDYYNINENYDYKKHKPKLRAQENPCADVADHAANCKVCSQLYKNDYTIFIIAIVILSIICIILLKRILEI